MSTLMMAHWVKPQATWSRASFILVLLIFQERLITLWLINQGKSIFFLVNYIGPDFMISPDDCIGAGTKIVCTEWKFYQY